MQSIKNSTASANRSPRLSYCQCPRLTLQGLDYSAPYPGVMRTSAFECGTSATALGVQTQGDNGVLRAISNSVMVSYWSIMKTYNHDDWENRPGHSYCRFQHSNREREWKKKKKAEPKQEGKQLQGKIRLPQPGKTPSRTMQGTAPSLNTAYKLKQLIKGQPGCREGGCSGVTITGTAGTQPQWDPEGYTGVILHCI